MDPKLMEYVYFDRMGYFLDQSVRSIEVLFAEFIKLVE